jgi:putative Holliday junction resolvase
MRILGIDYGRSKVGLAIAESPLAQPMGVIRYSNPGELQVKIKRIIQQNDIEKIIVGVSEGEMAKESKEFAKSLGAQTFDETLTSLEAQRLSMEAGIQRKKRKEMEDAFAATIMLQNYLDAKD